MPRKRQLIGPRKKIDIAALRALPREQRLNLLIQQVVESGGMSEAIVGATYRRRLQQAQRESDQRNWG